MDDSQKLFIEIEGIKHQMGRLVSNAESEKETRKQMNDLILNRINEVDNDLKDMFYGEDRKSGLVVDVDRLKQQAKEMNKFKYMVWASVITAAGAIVYELLKLALR